MVSLGLEKFSVAEVGAIYNSRAREESVVVDLT